MSQQYTEVEWQDPAGGNPGTLINKARLDQMQTAHHYADGLEETDTVPTADPGVAYHKIVYCTADNTLYRWDGTQWTADIDDPTRELLEEHLADHDNPHVVTKAQVGLGNADNTSDMDKPISTATQTALSTKADDNKVVHNIGNENVLGVKTHYSQILRSAGTLGEAFNYIVLGGTASGGEKMWEIKGESRADGTASIYLNSRKSDGTYETIVLGDGQGSSSNKVVTAGEMGIALATKADKATTLAGYGITDAYTKTEADTLLGAKADQATTYTKTEVQTYVSNALDGYLLMVRTTGNQSIAGIKTFTSGRISLYADTRHLAIYGGIANRATPPASDVASDIIRIEDDNGLAIDALYCKYQANGHKEHGLGIFSGGWKYLALHADADNTAYVTAPARTYDSSHTDDVVTIGTLKASTDVVHTSGNEIIAGNKIFQNANGFTKLELRATTGRTGNLCGLNYTDDAGNIISQIYNNSSGEFNLYAVSGSSKCIKALGQRAYSAGNTEDVATIGTLDAYTPMVRTTGNQTISGDKTFTKPIIGSQYEFAQFGSNTTAGWYAICKLPKAARELYLRCYSPGNLNFVMLETNTHVINVIKWVGNYTPNQNRFMWVETADAMILYIYSATYRTNIINIINYSVYGTPLTLSEIDKSVFTGQPVTKPEVGGDIVAVYDETLLNQVTQ